MTINDIIMFGNKENIYLDNEDYLKIFNAIKKNWQDLLYNDNSLKEYLKNNFSKEDYNKIYELFLKYKKKYSSYL